MPAVKDKVRNLPLAERKKLLHPVEVTEWDDDAPKGKPPQEYWQLLEYLMDCGTKTERLWTTSVAEETILGWVEVRRVVIKLKTAARYGGNITQRGTLRRCSNFAAPHLCTAGQPDS